MENASEALKMATGVLIAIVIIGIIVFEFNSISQLENDKEDQRVMQETTEFNKKFEAFNRSTMYGTDIISVIGMAISNNMIYNQQKYNNPMGNYDPDVEYSINIEFSFSSDIKQKTTKEIYVLNNINGKVEKDYSYPGCQTKKTVDGSEKTIFIKNKGYSLALNPYTNTNDKDTYNKINKIAIQGYENIIPEITHQGRKTIETIVDNSGYSEFKQEIFNCVDVKHNDVGRIYYMKFEPKKR